MYPILFDSKATSFNTNGLGRLSEAASCTVSEERNGAYELELEYPMSGIHFSDLKNENIIVAKPFQNGKLQAFRIYKVVKKAKDLATIYARHISYQLSYIPVSIFTADTAESALKGLKENAPEDCPFTFKSDVKRAGSFVMTKPDSARALMGGQDGSILDTFHGEYEWDNYTITLHESRGADKGVTIVYGKNLIDLNQEENIENTITGIYPYWQNTGNEPAAILGLDVVTGYYYNGKFYEDSAHKTEIKDLSTDVNYQDASTNKIYFWDGKKLSEDEIGRYGEGNIDLYDRPVYVDDEGYIESAGPISRYIDGKRTVIPTIGRDTSGNAVKWTTEEAETAYSETGEYFGKFDTAAKASEYIKKLETQQARLYAQIGETSTYVELSEKILYSDNASNYPYKRSVVKDFTQVFDTTPSEEELRDYTKQFIKENEIGVPEVSLDVNFINLFETPGYKDVAALQTVNLCDTVTVVFPKLGISTKSKVNKTEYDVLRERYTEIEIGDSKSTLSSTISDQLEQVMYRPTIGDVTKAIDRATGVLNAGTRGHVIINRNESGWANEILFLDNENIVAAKNVVRINMNGIGFSSTGYKGPYYQSWTNDGHLTLGGINDSYGELEILDEAANPTIIVDKDGLKLLALDYVGYYHNGKFYEDATFKTELPKKKNLGYYDRVTSRLYKWNGTDFVIDADAGVIAKMTHDGMNIKQGTIELLMDEEVGFSVDGEEIHLGDFVIRKDERQTLMASDEHTGMSAIPNRTGALYLWANWKNSDDYSFCVNSSGTYVMSSDRSRDWNVGDTLQSFEARLDALESGSGPDEPEEP